MAPPVDTQTGQPEEEQSPAKEAHGRNHDCINAIMTRVAESHDEQLDRPEWDFGSDEVAQTLEMDFQLAAETFIASRSDKDGSNDRNNDRYADNEDAEDDSLSNTLSMSGLREMLRQECNKFMEECVGGEPSGDKERKQIAAKEADNDDSDDDDPALAGLNGPWRGLAKQMKRDIQKNGRLIGN